MIWEEYRTMLSKKERFEEFLKQLDVAPPCKTAEEALEFLASTLNAVEDKLTNIPNNPSKWESDGRMYPPQPDSARSDPDRADFTKYRSRAHNTYIGVDGTIEIRDLSGHCLFKKSGA